MPSYFDKSKPAILGLPESVPAHGLTAASDEHGTVTVTGAQPEPVYFSGDGLPTAQQYADWLNTQSGCGDAHINALGHVVVIPSKTGILGVSSVLLGKEPPVSATAPKPTATKKKPAPTYRPSKADLALKARAAALKVAAVAYEQDSSESNRYALHGAIVALSTQAAKSLG